MSETTIVEAGDTVFNKTTNTEDIVILDEECPKSVRGLSEISFNCCALSAVEKWNHKLIRKGNVVGYIPNSNINIFKQTN